ncbi:hypothetical protein [Haladaptatus sp. DJG-WS-42]|uniref:DUF7095 family protein n=1 Tax=Haladaptatus sp. DJG-WS-42 TaxID=3120516 RepID=UPI0030CC69F5
MELDRTTAVSRVERLVETVESETMPVPVREIWVYGDLALGLDPVERLDIYLKKDLLFHGDDSREAEFRREYGVKGVGQTVSLDWAETYPEHIRANDNGHVAPEKCLAAHLVDADEPIHLEVCNSGFENNVTQRLRGAMAREAYEQILDPRGAALWIDGNRATDAFDKLRNGEYVFPTLAGALEMLGMDDGEAETAADVVRDYRASQQGASVRGDVV